MVKTLEKTHKSLYVTAKHILCLVKMLELGEVAKMKNQLEICTNTTVSTAPLEVTYGSVPSPTACNAHAPTSKPCDAVWVKEEYTDKAWFGDAPTKACLPCVSPTTTTTTTTTTLATTTTTTTTAVTAHEFTPQAPLATKMVKNKPIYVNTMGIDDSGYAYLSLEYYDGSSLVVKVDTASGNNLWEKTVPNLVQSSIAVDGQGNSFVGGGINPPHSLTGHSFGFTDFAIIKLDTNGNVMWKQQVGSSK